jgi:carbon-monoxide dehydrogenase medium subunit
MTLPRFEYIAPLTLEEACRLLKEKGSDARVMAGGTDLLLKMRHRLLEPKTVIGLKKIPSLQKIILQKGKGLTIGAGALLSEVAAHPGIRRFFPAVAYAAWETANVQVRNMGTLVGNLCNAAPSADNAPTLLVLEAEVLIMGTGGERRIPITRFFKGPGATVLESGEIVTAVHVPWPLPQSGMSYQHISARGKVDISAVGVAALVVMEDDMCREARIALGAVAPVPMRAPEAERTVSGRPFSDETVKAAAQAAGKECSPISDVRASAEWRRQMVVVLTERALREARERIKKNHVSRGGAENAGKTA